MRSFIIKAFIGISWIFGWYFFVKISSLPVYIFPDPLQIIQSFVKNFPYIKTHFLVTAGEVIIGLLIATICGVSTALLLDYSRLLQKILKPLLLAMQAVPMFALMPILIIWFGFGIWPKIFIICLASYFSLTICFLDGLRRIPKELLELAHIMKARPRKILWNIKIPAALPSLLSGLRISAIHTPLTVVAVDWLGANEGLGYLIMVSHGRLQIDLMFAGIICIILMTLMLNNLINFIEKKIIFWPSQVC